MLKAGLKDDDPKYSSRGEDAPHSGRGPVKWTEPSQDAPEEMSPTDSLENLSERGTVTLKQALRLFNIFSFHVSTFTDGENSQMVNMMWHLAARARPKQLTGGSNSALHKCLCSTLTLFIILCRCCVYSFVHCPEQQQDVQYSDGQHHLKKHIWKSFPVVYSLHMCSWLLVWSSRTCGDSCFTLRFSVWLSAKGRSLLSKIVLLLLRRKRYCGWWMAEKRVRSWGGQMTLETVTDSGSHWHALTHPCTHSHRYGPYKNKAVNSDDVTGRLSPTPPDRN